MVQECRGFSKRERQHRNERRNHQLREVPQDIRDHAHCYGRWFYVSRLPDIAEAVNKLKDRGHLGQFVVKAISAENGPRRDRQG